MSGNVILSLTNILIIVFSLSVNAGIRDYFLNVCIKKWQKDNMYTVGVSLQGLMAATTKAHWNLPTTFSLVYLSLAEPNWKGEWLYPCIAKHIKKNRALNRSTRYSKRKLDDRG